MDQVYTNERVDERIEASVDEATFLVIAVDRSMRITLVARRGELRGWPDRPNRGESAEQAFAASPPLLLALRHALAGAATTLILRRTEIPFGLYVAPCEGNGALALLVDLDLVESTRRHERQLRLLLQQLPASVWATDRDLVIREVAGTLPAQLGFTAAQIVGRSVAEFVGSRDPSHPAVAHHLAALEGQATRFHLRSGGHTYDISIEPLHESDGRVAGTVGLAVDATEHVDREAALARSQHMLAEAQRVAHVGSWEWSVARDRVTWSDELYRIYGVDPSRFDGSYQGFMQRVHPDDRDHTRRVVLDALRTQKGFIYDHRVVRPDGEVRMLHTRGEVVVDRRGRPERLVGCCWDVTERWAAEQSVARSASLLRATLESTADGLLVVDREGRMTAFNQRFAELWRLPAEMRERAPDDAALGLVLDQLEDPDAFLARVRELYAHPEMESYDVLRFKDGRVYERYSRPQKLNDQIVGRVWSFRDVTDRERLFRRALFLADASRLLASLDVEHATEAVAHLAVPFLGECCALDLFAEHGGPRRLFAVAHEHLRPFLDELPRAALSGHSLIYESGGRSCMAVPLTARDRLLGVLSFAASETRRYARSDLELAEELGRRIALALDNAQLYQSVQEALHARDDFLSVAAHELRGPATSMRLAVQSIRAGEVSAAQMPRTLDICDRAVRKIARFIDELLDVSRVRAGVLQLDLEDVDLAEVTREAASHLSHELSRSGSSLTITADAEVVGRWDRSRIEQVVTNLLANAIKFGQGRPIDVTVRCADGRAQLRVQDHGIGVPRDRQKAIFEPFERAVSARHYGGLGLGLYICRSIVDALGGTLHVDSEVGRGSTFVVELPRWPGGR